MDFLGAQTAALNLFSFGIDKPCNYLWYVMKRHPAPFSPFWKVEAKWPRHFLSLLRPWQYLWTSLTLRTNQS